MSAEYAPGDHVLVRGEVVRFIDGVGACVELFSNTDQYRAWVRTDLIEAKVTPPRIPEPGKYGVVRASGKRLHSTTDVLEWVNEWVNEGGFWRALDSGTTRHWDDLVDPILIREGVES